MTDIDRAPSTSPATMPWSHTTTHGLAILGAVAATIGILDTVRKLTLYVREWHAARAAVASDGTVMVDLEQGSARSGANEVGREAH